MGTKKKRVWPDCWVEGCPRKGNHSDHLCSTHWRRKLEGDPDWASLMGIQLPCPTDGCDKTTRTIGPCSLCAPRKPRRRKNPPSVTRWGNRTARKITPTCIRCQRKRNIRAAGADVWADTAEGSVCGPCLRGEPTPQAIEQARRLDVEHRRIRSAQEKRDAELAEQAFAPARRPTPAWQEAAIARSGVNASWHSISGHTDIGRGRNTNPNRRNAA